ncbi:MAG: helix-turn-helix transcriptional regulator [Phenylobacterium sp.]|uniref:helix-turn-helix domain-containing protein n=1 Tax=Phenylobacterium sp. TaxID=1871053 RepID=UPI0025F49305|nr:helix-turn-helix transcriptional regulator [Phenylobacterium sp.]MBI1198942.1 helix-turn-helix transcriptional regulator [Phenylobacterium sp.]
MRRIAVKLSPRQIQCLDLVRLGRTSPQIAQVLGLSARTVDQYVAEACARLQARNRTHAVAESLRLGLISQTTATASRPSRGVR